MFTVTIANPPAVDGYTVGSPSVQTVTITDDDGNIDCNSMVCACTVPFAAAAAAVLSLQSASVSVTEALGGVPVDITVVLTTGTGATLERDLVVTLSQGDGPNGGMLKYTEFRQCTACSTLE